MTPGGGANAQRQRAVRVLLAATAFFVLLAVAILSALAILGPLIWSRHLDVKLDGDFVRELETPPSSAPGDDRVDPAPPDGSPAPSSEPADRSPSTP